MRCTPPRVKPQLENKLVQIDGEASGHERAKRQRQEVPDGDGGRHSARANLVTAPRPRPDAV